MEFTEAFSPVRAITHGFAALRRAPLSVLVGGFVMFLVAMCSGGGGGGGDIGQMAEDQPPEVTMALAMMVLALLAVGFIVGILAFFVKCWLLPGWIRLQAHVLEHGTDNLPLLFSGADVFVRMLGWRFLHGLITFGTMLVALIPGGALVALGFMNAQEPTMMIAGAVTMMAIALPVLAYVGLGLSLGDEAVTLEGLGPVDALDRSWELARGNRLQLLLFFFIVGFFGAIGLLFCFVGLFVTRAIADVGTTEAFLLATKPEAKDWTIPREEGL